MSAGSGSERPKVPIAVLPMGRVTQLPEFGEERPTPDPESAEAADLRSRRDRKVAPLVIEGERTWLIDEVVDVEGQVCTFALLRRRLDRPGAPWYRERFKYDGQTDVLYHWGERPATQDEVRASRLAPPFRPPGP